jgi:hypothetical protein
VSLEIEPEFVDAVLLSDGWHRVEGESFTLDAYEYVQHNYDDADKDFVLHGGGRSGVCATGYRFSEIVEVDFANRLIEVAGPLTAIQAVSRTMTREENR